MIQVEDFSAAQKILNSFLPAIEQSSVIDRLIRILILQAKVFAGLGKNEEAISNLTRALELAQPGGYLRVFIDGGEEIAQLLYQCLQQDVHNNTVLSF